MDLKRRELCKSSVKADITHPCMDPHIHHMTIIIYHMHSHLLKSHLITNCQRRQTIIIKQVSDCTKVLGRYSSHIISCYGNSYIESCSKLFIKWSLARDWVNAMGTLNSEVAVAIAKTPQSMAPICFCTSHTCNCLD